MRQPNRKAPLIFRVGLVLLCAMLITTNMMGGLYARYSTTVIGSATARVAKFSGGTVTCDRSFNIDLTKVTNLSNCFSADDSSHIRYFAIDVDFSVKFDEAEVARKFILELIIVPYETIDGGNTSFECPENTTCKLNIDASEAINTANYIKDTLYYSVPNDTEVMVKEDGSLQLTGYVPIGAPEYNFEVTYFIPISYSDSSSLEEIKAESDIIAYNFICEQVD